MAPSFEGTLIQVWRQALVENVKFVSLGSESFPVRRTSKRGLRQVDFVFEGQEYGIVSNKFFSSLLGGTVWLVTSKGRPRGYYLCSSFVVDKVEHRKAGRFRNHATGSKGRDFDVEIGSLGSRN